jgi:hypothetical protein
MRTPAQKCFPHVAEPRQAQMDTAGPGQATICLDLGLAAAGEPRNEP